MTHPDTTLEAAATRNLIDSAVEHLRQPVVLPAIPGPSDNTNDELRLIAVPENFTLERLDTEDLLPRPRRLKAAAEAHDLDTFVAYVKRFGTETTIVWVKLDPRTNALTIRAQIDENDHELPSWRTHSATFTPRLSVEWQRWLANAGAEKARDQAAFATFLEDNLCDIATVEGMPTGGDMLQMALDFEVKQDMRFKSAVRLQSGGIDMQFVSTDDAATLERMQVFDRFTIGVPVFWSGSRYPVEAKLRYRAREGRVVFWYELVRSDRVHETAARELIEKLREQLPEVPLFMGSL